jgi:glycosyltransferase involved in cell wall biosynthesis
VKIDALQSSDEGIRILMFLPDGWPTFRPDVSALFGRYLAKEGVVADIVTHRANELVLQPWPGKVLTSKASNKLSQAIQQARYMLTHDLSMYDAIQVRDHPIIAIVGLIRAKIHRKAFIYWMSFPLPEADIRIAQSLPLTDLLKKLLLSMRGLSARVLLDRVILPLSDHVFVQTDAMLKEVASRGVDAGKLTAVPMCIDPERFDAPLPRVERNDRQAITIGYLGSCDRIRCVDFLFEVVAVLREEGRDVRLLLIGDAATDRDRQWLSKRADETGASAYTELTGWLPADEAADRLMDVDVAAALCAPDPILDVGSPTKLIEYLALGLPVVSNSHPDQSLVIFESQGGICVDFKVHDFAKAIVETFDNSELSSQRTASGRSWVMANRSYPLMARKVAEVYRRVLRCGVNQVTERTN